MTIDSADDSKISNRTINTNRTYEIESNHEASQISSVHITCTDVYKPPLYYNDLPLCIFWFVLSVLNFLFHVMCCFGIVNDEWIMMSEWVSGMLIRCCCRSTVWQVTVISWLKNCLHSTLWVSLRLSVCVCLCLSLSLSLPLWYCAVRLLTILTNVSNDLVSNTPCLEKNATPTKQNAATCTV